MIVFHDRVYEGIEVDDDVLKVFGFDSLERLGDPLGEQSHPCPQKPYSFELCGLGEVMGNHSVCSWVREVQ